MGNRKLRILAMIAVGLLTLVGTPGMAQAQSGTHMQADDRRANPAGAAAARERSGQPVARTALEDSGPWHFVNRHSGRCLTIQNASTAQNALAVQYACENTPPFNEDWFLDDLSPADPYFHIVNSHSGRCLTIQNASLNNNALALQYTCDYEAPFNEEWVADFVAVTNPYYRLINRHSGLCLTIQNASLNNNALALQYTCDYEAPFNEGWGAVAVP